MSDEPFFIPIDALEEVGISVADVNKLKQSGLTTVLAVQQQTRRSLEKIKGMSEAKVSKIKEAAAKLCPATFKTGSEVSVAREKVVYLSTGSKALDAVLGGGISTQSITFEIYGEFRTGKTQLCHTLAVTCQLPVEEGGGSGKVAIIDTEGTFRPDRIRAISQRFGVDADAALDNIIVARAQNSEHQTELINILAGKFAEDGTFKLLIIDSILALFRTDYSGRGELATRQQQLGIMLSNLTKLAEGFGIAVIYSNHVQSDPGASSMFAGASDKKPIGGHVLAHASTTRIALRKGRGDERIAKLADSPEQAEGEATYRLTSGGVEDV